MVGPMKDRALHTLYTQAAEGVPMSALMADVLIAIGHGATWEETDLAVRMGQSAVKVNLN